MDIGIKNEEQVISTCENILSYSTQIDSHIESLETSLNKINAEWESTGHDKESYVLELEKQIENLKSFGKGVKDMANSIIRYVENIKNTSSKTVSN